MTAAEVLRSDLRLMADLVPDGARVLDLGCGDGALLEHLRDRKQAFVRGVELSFEGVVGCIDRGVSVYRGDLDEGLAAYSDDSFDLVVLSQTLQVVRRPDFVVREMLRVARRGLISYPNFGYWRTRAHLALRGRMPVSDNLPYEWYDTPNIHPTTIKDFRAFCSVVGAEIERELALSTSSGVATRVRLLPNLLSDVAIAVVRRA